MDVDPVGSPYTWGENNWAGYDNAVSAAKKTEYIKANKLGGAIVWDISMDDFHNDCGGGVNPLINSIVDTLNSGSPGQTTTARPVTTGPTGGNPTTTKPSSGGGNITKYSSKEKILLLLFLNSYLRWTPNGRHVPRSGRLPMVLQVR